MTDRAFDRARVRALLGREPLGDFDVVVRDVAGDPVVIRNAPLLDDGTPMPTRYWLVGPDAVRRVGRLEAAGGVDAAERAVDAGELEQAHQRYAAERDALVPPTHEGPRPSGGVAGTRTGVKCLHAHYAWFLAGGDDPVGRWVHEQLERADRPRLTIGARSCSLEVGDRWSVELPVGIRQLADEVLADADPPAPEQLLNAIGLVDDHLADVLLAHPELAELRRLDIAGPLARTVAAVELGHHDVPDEFELDRDAAEDVFRTVATERAVDRAANPGLPAEHVGDVVAACCAIVAVMRRLHLATVTVTAPPGSGD